ncbi:hypothetical protein [Halovivax gelatinilyticus]|uniref:hypothetical protein n=1 Tax=Halovivax gelatinilyticus TaxID=2961597 RepID=UPI0020CA3982|nr:hypothetical protein [Halovivax gelatinilyticus]
MPTDESDVVRAADTVSSAMYGLAGWLLIGFGLALAISSLSQASDGPFALVGVGFAIVLLAFGVFVNPGLRRRIDRRHGIDQFGTVRSVDHRVFRPDRRTVERCLVCDEPTDRGLIRRYREEVVLAGFPIYTRSVGYNHYCPDCASTEILGTDAPGASQLDSTDAKPAQSSPSSERSTTASVETDGDEVYDLET